MTTNHPAQFDPALIRPGRIDKQLLLGHLRAPEAILMIRHYFGAELTDAQDGPVAPRGSRVMRLSLPGEGGGGLWTAP